MKGAAERKAAAKSHERIRILSYLRIFFERQTRVHSSHSSFSRRSFFELCPAEWPAVIDRRYRADSNEVETGKYSGSWLPRLAFANRILFPAFTVPHSREDWPWEIVSSHSSATAPEFHGIPHAAPQP